MFRPSKIMLTLPAFGACLFFLLGCGEPAGAIRGKVTYKGTPVTAGSVTFHLAEKGIAQSAKLDSTGNFAMSAPLPVGTYKVSILPPAAEPQDPSKGPAKVIPSVVPKRYQNPQSSDISAEVKAGKNDIPIELKD